MTKDNDAVLTRLVSTANPNEYIELKLVSLLYRDYYQTELLKLNKSLLYLINSRFQVNINMMIECFKILFSMVYDKTFQIFSACRNEMEFDCNIGSQSML